MHSPIQRYLETLHEQVKGLRTGDVAQYIPELARVAPDGFGICIVTLDGVAYATGDSDQLFTIQSISKPFVYATALMDRGQEHVSRRVGVEPSGDAFNSISLDPQTGAPLNPMINAGAIAATSMVGGDTPEEQWERIHRSLGIFAGRELAVDEVVYQSESRTGARNRAIAWMLKNFGIIEVEPMAPLENYFRQCSVQVSCRDLAYMAATLANGGTHPLTCISALPAGDVARVLSVMASCGMYDYSGSWLYEVGIPAKSGVGGGIIAVLPGRFGIGIYSPRLDAKGNSARGIEVCKRLSRDLGLNIFSHGSVPATALLRVYTGADAPSRREPAPGLRKLLSEQAHRIKYLSLHGYLALDSVEYIIRKMQELAPGSSSFILDMKQVTGISDSAARILHEARLDLMGEEIAVVFSRIQERKGLMEPLRRNGVHRDRGFLCFEDNDLAVEWCENRLCGSETKRQITEAALGDFALFSGLPPEHLLLLDGIMATRTFAHGEQILVNNQQDDGRIFFMEAGTVSILVPRQTGGHQRISTLGPGMNFGEMVLLGQTTRSASVHADSEVRCRILESADLNRLTESLPSLKIMLLENLARDLSNKLRPTTQLVAALA